MGGLRYLTIRLRHLQLFGSATMQKTPATIVTGVLLAVIRLPNYFA